MDIKSILDGDYEKVASDALNAVTGGATKIATQAHQAIKQAQSKAGDTHGPAQGQNNGAEQERRNNPSTKMERGR
jgi:hypothetical protein